VSPPTHATLIFLHLPKTAGTTLARILDRQYRLAAVLRLYHSSSGAELATMPQAELERVRVIMGHFKFGAHQFLSRPSCYVTVLREPIERVISHYFSVRRSPTHYLYDVARGMSLSEFVVACGPDEPNNDQIRLLAGDAGLDNSGRSGQHMLAAAKQHLNDHFVVTGLTEDFDRSLLVMKRALGWTTPFYVKENVTRHRPPKERISEETLQVIAAHNQLDIELYQHARALLQANVQLHGISLERELRRFKQLNPVFGRLVMLVRSRLPSH
jgi:hypothetical protein